MFIDLTTKVNSDNPVMKFAETAQNKHIFTGHIGTHLDTYEKTHIPLEYFKSKGIIFDVRNKPEIGLIDVNLSKIPKNSFVIFRTGRMEIANYGEKEYFDNPPELTDELIAKLIKLDIRFIGIDCAGIKHKGHEAADRLCEQNDIYVIENLCNLNKIHENNFIVYTMWLDDEKMTGLKCRVIVEEN